MSIAWLCIPLTLAVFEAASRLARSFRALNPTLVTILTVMGCLRMGHVSLHIYTIGAAPLAALLGPATVALGAPMARHWAALRRDCAPILAATVAGSLTVALTGPALFLLCGGTPGLALALAPKAATTPIAMAVAAEIGAAAPLAALFAIVGGVIAAVAAGPVLGLLGVRTPSAFGLAAGVAGSGIGAAEAVARDPRAGAFAALGVGLTALTTALAVPLLVAWGAP
jgi:putative effector of murein hydrolase